jgi:hypothetical protein
MPARNFRVGVASVSVFIDDPTVVASAATLVYTASATATTDSLFNDVKTALDTTATYQVIVGLVGRDAVNKGYTVGYCSPGSGIVSVSAGQGILVNVPNANWPAGFQKAACAAIFLKKNNGNFILADFAYIDPSNDFNHMIMADALPIAANFTSTVLQSTTVDPILGSRAPLGFAAVVLSPTTGGVQVSRGADLTTLSPDTSTDFQRATTRSTSISFGLLSNDIKDIIRGWAGIYSSYTSGGKSIEEAQMSLLIATGLVVGNRPFQLTMPLNSSGKQEIRLYLAKQGVNNTPWVEDWQKAQQTPVRIQYDDIAEDALFLNCHTELVYRKNT